MPAARPARAACSGAVVRQSFPCVFTGLVQFLGNVAGNEPSDAGRRLALRPVEGGVEVSPGDSVCVQGVCLTVVNTQGGLWSFDVVPETLAATTLAGLRAGDRVNLELAATLKTLFGGHIVQGHVDGVGTIEKIEHAPEWRVRIKPPADLMDFIMPKGSITIDGVSLTVARREALSFEVALIPTTLEKTTLRDLRPSSRCNLEVDIITKSVVHAVRARQETLP